MELQVGVKVLLKNREGKYLLLRRSPAKYPGVGAQWDIVGGRIHAGTNLLENLKREVKEETNLDLKNNVQLVAAQDILRDTEKHIVRLTYIGTIDGDPQIDKIEHLAYRWITKEEMQKMGTEELDPYVRELLEKRII